MRTEEEIIKDLENYIKGWKRNRPNVLASIKKSSRTKRIVDLIFSRPDVFKLENEIKHVPEELLTEELLIKFVLSNPKHIGVLDEKVIKTSTLVAFEFAKRRYERFSSLAWGVYGEKLKVPEIYKKFRDDIWKLCDLLSSKFDDSVSEKDELMYLEKVTKEIIDICNPNHTFTPTDNNYTIKYRNIDFGLEKKLYIFITGYPDSGKTTLGNMLNQRIKGSVCFDSDMMLERDMIGFPLEALSSNAKVVIFSDIYAYRFFSSEETKDGHVINILISPYSIELMYRNSKYMQHIPFEDYKKCEINCIHFDETVDFIHVTNDYTERIYIEVDRIIDEIIKRLESLGLNSGENTLKMKINY